MNAVIVLVFLVPLAGGLVTCLPNGRPQLALGLLAAGATVATVAVLGFQLQSSGVITYRVGGWPAPLGIRLHADGLSLLMLALTAVIALFVSLYAVPYFAGARRGPESEGFFWPLWLLLWGGLNCLFVAADLFTLYLLLETTLLASVALAALGGSKAAHVSALRYLLAGTGAGLVYVLGLALWYADTRTLDYLLLAETSPAGPGPLLGLGLMLGSLVLKSALFPLHFWLPPAHSTAPAPVSAVLSALVVKAAFYVLFRLWFQVAPEAAPAWLGQALATLGAVAILWGSWQALRQSRLKMLVAYSTVAQLGYLFLLFPLAASGDGKLTAATVYHVLSHGLAKAAMFLGAGALLKACHSDALERTRGSARRAPLAVAAVILAGAALAGVLPGAGSKGKLLAITHEHGQWWWSAVIVSGMVLAAAYTFVAVREAFRAAPADHPPQPHRLLDIIACAVAVLAFVLSFNSSAVLALLEIR